MLLSIAISWENRIHGNQNVNETALDYDGGGW